MTQALLRFDHRRFERRFEIWDEGVILMQLLPGSTNSFASYFDPFSISALMFWLFDARKDFCFRMGTDVWTPYSLPYDVRSLSHQTLFFPNLLFYFLHVSSSSAKIAWYLRRMASVVRVLRCNEVEFKCWASMWITGYLVSETRLATVDSKRLAWPATSYTGSVERVLIGGKDQNKDDALG